MGILSLALLLGVVVYIPAVQKFAVGKASEIVARKTGYHLTVERFRMRFPLGVSVVEATVITPAGDTLARIGRAQVHAALLPLIKGQVRVSDIGLENTAAGYRDTVSGMTLRARINALRIATAEFDPARKSIGVGRTTLDRGDVALSMGSGSGDPAPAADTLSPDWKIEVSRFDLLDFALALDMPVDSVPAPATPFDYHHIRASEVGMSVRDLKFRGGDISVRFEKLHLAERSGLTVTDGGGDFEMNGTGLFLKDFVLATTGSHLEGSVTAGEGIMKADPQTPVSAQLTASVSTGEIALFAPLPAQFEPALAGKNVTVKGDVKGTLDHLTLDDLSAALAPNVSLKASGTLRSLREPAALSGNVTLDGELLDLDFARSFVADTALRHRLAIPRGMTLHARADFTPESYNVADFTLRADTGRIEGKGRFAPGVQTYEADLRIVDFPLDRFLPRDSLGVVAGSVTASGQGFDPTALQAEADVALDRLDYKNTDLGHITAHITADKGDIAAHVKSLSDLLVTDISLDALLARDSLADPSHRPVPMSYLVDAQIDSTVVRFDGARHSIASTTLHASASMAGMRANLRSGDLAVDVSSPLPIDSLIRSASKTGSEVQRQLAELHFSPDSLQSAFPAMTLRAKAGRGNFLHEFARLKGLDFRNVSADLSTEEGKPFHVNALATEITAAGLEADTLALHAVRNGNLLDYELRLANRPGAMADLGLISVSGSASGRALTANILQRNLEGATGFDFGIRASLRQDSTIRAEFMPNPVLGYEQWVVGAEGDTFHASAPGSGNWVEYGLDGTLRADLHLTTPERHIALTSASLPGIPDGALRLEAGGLDIESMLDLFPTAPPVGGLLSSDITFGFHSGERYGNIIGVRGTVGAKDFKYQSRRVADIDANVGFISGDSGRMLLNTSVQLDKRVALTAKGTYSAGAIDFNVDIPGVPLAIVEGFLPAGTADLTGDLDGKVRISGDPSHPTLEGDLGFTGAKAEILMIGTTFGISPERVTIADNRVTFNNFGLVAPNERRLAINGVLGIANLAAPTADLSVRTRGFQFVNSRHVGGSQLYGTGSLDANITARGALNAISVRGDVDLSGDTDIVYILRGGGQEVRDEKQHIVQFVSFADSLSEEDEIPLPPLGRVGVDMLIGVNIGEGLKATVSLDELNENRVELVGGGDLSLSMNTQGDTRMSGRYTLSGGVLYYKPPVIPQKIFAVADGSYVEWAGPVASPQFHVTATQAMDVRLNYDGGDEREVEFEITVAVSGSLSGIDMTFDVAAPGDLMIQDQLMAMSNEGRMQQALSLLIYNQYTGPGVSSKGTAFNARNQLNDFISKEVNQWARNNLKGVDISMGINTHDVSSGGTYTDYSYSVSKSLFSDRVKISIGGKVSDGAGASEGFADNLLEDVSLEYRLTRRDNMFLKLYRYNTRESILEGEVTETGGGFMIRKKMNRLRDIFRRTGPRRNRNAVRSDSLRINNTRQLPPVIESEKNSVESEKE